jgi:hypothetical protein
MKDNHASGQGKSGTLQPACRLCCRKEGSRKRRPATVNTGPDLFAWADAQRARQRRMMLPRVILLPDAASPDGLPRAGLLHPGARLPVVFPTLPAALAVLASMEAQA